MTRNARAKTYCAMLGCVSFGNAGVGCINSGRSDKTQITRPMADHGDGSSVPKLAVSAPSRAQGIVISIVRSLPLLGCWILTQAQRLSFGSKYMPVNSEPTVPLLAQPPDTSRTR